MIRGIWNHAGVLYSVEDDFLYVMQGNGTTTQLAQLNSRAGPIDFESTLTQLCFTDGTYLYVYDPISQDLSTAVGYPGGDRISFINQRINALQRGTQKFYWSDLGNAGNFDPLAFKSAESSPDLLISQVAFNGELVLFGQESTEIFDPTTEVDDGDAIVYQKSSAAIDYGCIAPFSAQKTPNSVYWLSQDKGGHSMVLSLQGHQAKRVSTRAEEEMFEGLNLANARAFTYSSGGQSLYLLNVPGLDTTLVWDETFNQWHERAEGTWNNFSKWRPTCHAFCYGKHYFAAGEDLYALDPTLHKYGDDVNCRGRVAPVISKPTMDREFYASLEILCEKGTGAKVLLQYSDDNGANWSNTRETTVGKTGRFNQRAIFNRLGAGFNRVFRIWMTDDAPFNPVAVNIPL